MSESVSQSPVTYCWNKLSSSKWQDAWEERLGMLENTSLVISSFPMRPTIRVELYSVDRGILESVQSSFGGTIREVKDAEWMETQNQPGKPLKIRDQLIVSISSNPQEWEILRQENPKRVVLGIPAEMAFGTGDHPTTATCLRMLVDEAVKFKKSGLPWSFLDAGTGSGILALAAKALGANNVAAYDYDDQAVKTSIENARRNHIEEIHFFEADVYSWQPDQKREVMVANIYGDILVEVFPRLVQCVKPDGTLIVSGILASQGERVLEAGKAAGIDWERPIVKGKWLTAKGRVAG